MLRFNERDPYGLSRVRRRFKLSRFWVDALVLEALLVTLLLLLGSLYCYSVIVRIALRTETSFDLALAAGTRCACRIDDAFLLDLTVAVLLLNAKAASVLLIVHDAERMNRLLFVTGNLKVLDYVLTRVADYAGQTTDRTRRLASIALNRASGGQLSNVIETNLNHRLKGRLSKLKSKSQ